MYQNQGQYDQALSNFQQALVIAREIGYSALEDTALTYIEAMPETGRPSRLVSAMPTRG